MLNDDLPKIAPFRLLTLCVGSIKINSWNKEHDGCKETLAVISQTFVAGGRIVFGPAKRT